jgi:hypothetical protein
MGHYDDCGIDPVKEAHQEKMYNLSNNIIESRAGGKVERCHGVVHIGSYSNAAHSWGVAMLMHYLWPEDFPRLALVCLAHDVPERVVGDIPSPPLHALPGLKENIAYIETLVSHSLGLPNESDLSEEDYRKLKACDHLELWIWSKEQLFLGNRFAEECILALEDAWKTSPLPKEAEDLRKYMTDRDFRPERINHVIQRLMS